ncbi:CaiB/BaiF CoA transferase family protein [Saccharopolyspora phatthalungensis]|uniref:Crotonobetainyl-CoA:carnitine CoA-transferase CaiB-like acyl-CoA transferase n=1 Tax=Saccharopolyspora phatthalungensis TaxID=664693 RepID=A0A840Q3L2_9PSEU|nr:CoA transferase [Saccharopolyspora phatthalungensis]MBB5157102.1 crotonobetainyl-CoA:carnitine CoA-transferase CaiB-like acyl-CoA transferase [Saccharopolyspora phatthalungensis]
MLEGDACGPLAGVRVLDVTQMLAGPMAAMRLADLGADVIKIEPPEAGEFNRTHGYAGVDIEGHKTTFLGLNRNKRSLAVDLKSAAGRELFHKLVAGADVLVQNFRVGTVQRLGIDFEAVHKINLRLVYASISGYGLSGPGAGRPGQDLVLQGYSGSMWFVGAESDPPVPGGIPAIDAMTGYQVAIGVLAALRGRDATGVGTHVEVDMLSVVLDAQVQELVTYLNAGVVPARGTEAGAHAWVGAPYGVYRTADGWLTLAMCPVDVLGDALDDDVLRSYTRHEDAQLHSAEIYRRIRPRFAERTTQQWIEHLDGFNIWSGPVYDYRALEADAQVQARGLIVEMEHPEAGTVRTIASPIRLDGRVSSIRKAPPLLGADTRDLLTELGYAESASNRR